MTTVYVACKLPHGLILRIFKQTTVEKPVVGDATRVRDESRAQIMASPIKIKGYCVPNGKVQLPSMPASYAVTPNVDEEFIRTWFEQNKDTPLVTGKFVMFHAKEDSLRSMIRENEKRRNGFEPLNPEKLPNVGNVTNYVAA